MKAVRIISLIARVALMVAMVLGLLFWIAQISFISTFMSGVAQVIIGIHPWIGLTGALFLLVLGVVAIFTRGIRLPGVGGVVYAAIMPAFGLTQSLILMGNLHWLIQVAHLLVGVGAMYLARGIERRYLRLRVSGSEGATISGATAAQAVR
ncbi:MAG: hypothetical protein J2P37_23370 [Ktedonobacteraceae bacterium]|nr:hypothetical protein [Ktedonobacteraceae bacterium]